MDYATLDHLSLFAEQTHPRLKQELQNNGIIDHSGSPDINMINIRTGTFTAIVVRILHLINEVCTTNIHLMIH